MGDTFTQILPLNPQTSDHTPALATHLGNLILCWKGTENTEINFWSSSKGGQVFDGPHFVESAETTDAAPALAALRDKLYVAWKGTGNTTLNIGQVGMTFDSNGFISSFTGITGKVELTMKTSDRATTKATPDRHLRLISSISSSPSRRPETASSASYA
jgi:hypothetical protein